MTPTLQSGEDPSPDSQVQVPERRDADTSQEGTAAADASNVQCDALLGLLGDEYACDIIRALSTGPMTGRDLLDQFDMSRPTVYRRLDDLTAAGLVDSDLVVDRDGNHRQEYRLVYTNIEFRITADDTESPVSVAEVTTE